MWAVEMSGEGWGAAEGPVDAQDGRAVGIPRLLCAELPTHHLGRKRSTRGRGKSGVDTGEYARPRDQVVTTDDKDRGRDRNARRATWREEVFAISGSVNEASGEVVVGEGLGLLEELCRGSLNVLCTWGRCLLREHMVLRGSHGGGGGPRLGVRSQRRNGVSLQTVR